MYCSAGLYSRLVNALKQDKVDIKYTDLRQNKITSAKFEALLKLQDVEFRHRQLEVISAIECAEGGVIVCPTGYGKTFIISLLSVIYPTSAIAVISPGLDLLRSTYTRLQQYAPNQIGRIGGGHHEYEKRILLCSADSIHKLPMGKIHLLIYDEVHTAATQQRSEALCSQYTDAKFIGFTASPNVRSDGADAVVESIFGPVLLQISYAEAADKGIVAKINTKFVEVPRCDQTIESFGDNTQRKRISYWCNDNRNQVIARTCQSVPQLINNPNPQILVMVETVEHMFELRRHLPDYEVVYASMDEGLRRRLRDRGLINEHEAVMDTSRRKWLLDQFQRGHLRKVIANHCWKQGIDPIHLNCFVRADGGTSDINNIQLPGRLSRITEGKTEGLLIDFMDSFDPWALRRSQKRLKAYRKANFAIIR